MLPKIIATVTIPEGKGEDSPYERFRGLILTGMNVYQNYTITKGGEKGGYFDEQGAFVLERTPHLEHIHRYNKEKENTEQLLASIRVERGFSGEKQHVLEIYDNDFANFVNEMWGNVTYVKREEKKEQDDSLFAKH